MDWDAVLSAPIHSVLGVDAVLVTACGEPPLTIRVLDMSGGVTVGRDIGMDTIRPAADVRATLLTAAGIAFKDLEGSTLTMNGKDWVVKSFIPLPAATGVGQGELRLILEEE